MSRDLIIIGGSARAAAVSAIRAGFAPWAADLFADADLQAVCPVVRCPFADYPHGFVEIMRSAPAAPWLYTGGLENYPDLIRELTALRPLWGNCGESLTHTRTPHHVANLLLQAGIPALKTALQHPQLSAEERWLRKPRRGSAGQGISFAEANSAEHADCYFQQFMPGSSMSAVFVRGAIETRLLGVTEQLIGCNWLYSSGFRYCGNVGPIDLPIHINKQLSQIGQVIGDGCDLRGLFGVDFILADECPWVVEVNPRYTASIEVLELATGISALAEHARAFTGFTSCTTATWGKCVGKAILYANRRLAFGSVPIDDVSVRYADVPASGEVIESGWPILTILAAANSSADCHLLLRSAASRFDCGLPR